MKLNVNEIFYSLQGEGGRQGEASIFIRLTNCNLRCSFCDTNFYSGKDMSLEQILDEIKDFPAKWIVWTGGEPTLQLESNHLEFFREKGYKQAIETNGTNAVPSGIDYISCSPKVNIEKIASIIPIVDEIRLPIKVGDSLPPIESLPKACKYFLSPISDEKKIIKENVYYCVNMILQNPRWQLSLQMHKLINIE